MIDFVKEQIFLYWLIQSDINFKVHIAKHAYCKGILFVKEHVELREWCNWENGRLVPAYIRPISGLYQADIRPIPGLYQAYIRPINGQYRAHSRPIPGL